MCWKIPCKRTWFPIGVDRESLFGREGGLLKRSASEVWNGIPVAEEDLRHVSYATLHSAGLEAFHKAEEHGKFNLSSALRIRGALLYMMECKLKKVNAASLVRRLHSCLTQ